jgi:hypothetical protein
MVSYILIILAAICNSAMDVVSFHYSTSIFTKLNNAQFFDPSISWTNKYIDHDPKKGIRKWFFGLFYIPVMFTDFWHLCKTISIFALIGSVTCYTTFIGELLCKDLAITNTWMCFLVRAIDYVLMGTIWNITFSLFFNHIFVSSKKS